MRYDEKTEIESTREWLIRFDEAGFSEELTYVPSELWKLGIAPKDVVDRLDWLKKHAGHGTVEVEEPVEEEPTPEDEEVPVVEEPPEEMSAVSDAPVSNVLTLDYDRYGAWEWVEAIENMIEETRLAVFEPEPGLPEFNELASLVKSKKRVRGRKARATTRTNKLVSNSVGS